MNSTVDSPVPYSSQAIGTPALDVTPSRSGYLARIRYPLQERRRSAGRALGLEPAQEALEGLEGSPVVSLVLGNAQHDVELHATPEAHQEGRDLRGADRREAEVGQRLAHDPLHQRPPG